MVTISGCATQPDVAPSTFIGKTVAKLDKSVPSGTSFAWYDLSEQTLHQPGTLISGADPDDEGVIVAVCANAKTIGSSSRISAGAIPASNYDGAIRRNAEAGKFRELLPECQPQ